MLRLIQVGVGGMGRVWTAQVAHSNQWEAVAYVDVHPENLKAAAAVHGMPDNRCFTDLKSALDQVQADALLDCTPQEFRKSVCIAALNRGLHVLSEKPLADTLANAKAIVERARKKDRIYMVAQNYRYQSVPQTVKRFLADGRLGRVGYVSVRFHKGPHFGGFREEMPYPLVLDMSIHHLDLMRCLLGSDIAWVSATSIKAPWSWFKGDASVMAAIEMENGIAVNYCGSWVAQGKETPWNGDWRFDGDKGALLWENDSLAFSDSPDKQKRVRLMKWPLQHQAYLLKAFADAVITGEEPDTSGRRNLNSLAATFAVLRAIKERRRVAVSEVLA